MSRQRSWTSKEERKEMNSSLDRSIALLDRVFKGFAPPASLTVTEWADTYRFLSQEASAEPGKYASIKTPYAKEIMDACGDKSTRRVVIKAAAQVCKSEILLNTLGYFAHVDPCPMLMILPNLTTAKNFSAERLAPMVRDTPVLREIFSDRRSKDGGSKIQRKAFRGGYVALASAEIAADLASRPVRCIFFDEIDRAPRSAGEEGDPLSLASKRTATFWNSKEIISSTPTIEGDSPIDICYLNSTQERWFVPCPDCGHYQVLSFSRMDFKSLLHKCEKCEKSFDQIDWQANNVTGKWIASRTHDDFGREIDCRGFHLDAMVSPFFQWSDLAAEFLEGKRLLDQGDPNTMISFVNTRLAQTWKDNGDKIEEQELIDRRETYPADLPDGVLYLTCGCDVQEQRIEGTVIGWGKGHEAWIIEHFKIYGDTRDGQIFEELQEQLEKEYGYADGIKRPIDRCFIDSGGTSTQSVYGFVRRKQPRILAIKGQPGLGQAMVRYVSTRNQGRVPLAHLSVDVIKEEMITRLCVQNPGPGYIHFPKGANDEETRGIDLEYFKCLTAEKRITKFINGFRKHIWAKLSHQANESWDTLVYNRGALAHAEGKGVDLETAKRPTGEPKQPFVAKWQQNIPAAPTRPLPVQTASTNATAAAGQQPEKPKFVPRWRQN
jgi:phage terminase large subunit GpA-like protein